MCKLFIILALIITIGVLWIVCETSYQIKREEIKWRRKLGLH